MAFGKREQIVVLSIGVLAAIGVIHMVIFKPKADEFTLVQDEYNQGREKLKGALVLPSQNWLKVENEKTVKFREQVTSVVAQLNVDTPDYFKTNDGPSYEKRYNQLLDLMKRLVQMKQTVQQPRLTFLGDRRLPNNPWEQLGWNLPAKLPMFEQNRDPVRARAQLWDLIGNLEKVWNIANSISDAGQRMGYRERYNEYLTQLGLSPVELSNFIYRPNQQVATFFNDKKLFERFGQQAQINPYSINRFGVFLPDLKKMWVLELIWAERDQTTPFTKEKLFNLLEINLPFDEKMLYISKQLAALIDVIAMAQKSNVVEITQVHMMKPADFVKAERRIPGQTPTGTPTPTPAAAASGGAMDFEEQMMRGGGGAAAVAAATPVGEKVAVGAGLEIYFRATNSSTFDFLFDVGTMPRTYALDDLYIQALQGNELYTSATIEMVMKLEEAAPAAPPQ